MFVELELPPGVYRNGTDMQAAGRWRDVSLVRWHEGKLQPIRGWTERADFTSGVYRGAIAWQDNSGDRWLAVGSHDALKVSTRSGTVSDITPAGLTSGIVDASQNLGYGGGSYGAGDYGTARPGGDYSEATTWSLDTWGEYLIGCNPADGAIWEWQLNTAANAAVVSNAPTGNMCVHVTYERFVFALGAGGDPRKVQWCDREDNTSWVPSATNEAGSQVLESVGQIMCAANVPDETLILTDHEAFMAEYSGPPFVYGFHQVGAACGVASRRAVAEIASGALWMGVKGFFGYFGGAVETIECEVFDYVFEDINQSQISKVHAITNSAFNEVWWFYPSAASNECDRYVIYNHQERHWSIGVLARTTGVDLGTMIYPVWLGEDSKGYDHDIGFSYDGGAVYAESGPINLGQSGNVVSATELLPDEKTQGDVTLTIKTRLHPNGPETEHGPYPMANPTSVRITGRQIRLRVGGSRLAAWRWGIPRLEVHDRGRR